MVNPVLTRCILWHLCSIMYPFKLQNTKRTICYYLAGLNVTLADMKYAMFVSSGLLVLVGLQHGQLFVPYQIKEENSSGMMSSSLLYQAIRVPKFCKTASLHLKRRRNRGLRDSWLYELVDEFEYSFKLSREWISLSLLRAVKSGLLGCFGNTTLVPSIRRTCLSVQDYCKR